MLSQHQVRSQHLCFSPSFTDLLFLTSHKHSILFQAQPEKTNKLHTDGPWVFLQIHYSAHGARWIILCQPISLHLLGALGAAGVPHEWKSAGGKMSYLDAVDKCLLTCNIVFYESPSKGWLRLALNSWSCLTAEFLPLKYVKPMRVWRLAATCKAASGVWCVEADSYTPFSPFLSLASCRDSLVIRILNRSAVCRHC